MDENERTTRAQSFGAAADVYVQGRPSYPAAAIAWVVPASATDVADVGAGTGKLTAGMLAPGRHVTAIDPDAAMLATLSTQVPGVVTRVGTGEHLPLPDASMDAVTFGQAWHWVDQPAASLEAARVLRPGGVLGLLWNIRDESVSWVAELGAIMHGSDAEHMIAAGGPSVGPPFAGLETETYPWSNRVTPDSILAMAASRSYLITASDADRAAVLDGIRHLLGTHPDTAGRDELELPYITHAFRAVAP